MKVDQNLDVIKTEPLEIKSETEDELLVEITAQGIAGGQEFEETTGPISGSGVIKTEPTEIKSEPKDEPVVEFTAQDVVVGGQKFKEESDNDSQSEGPPKEPEIQADNQSVFHALDDNESLVMKSLGESQSEDLEVVDMSPYLYKSINMTIIEEQDEPEFINIYPSSTVSPSKYTILESHRVQCNYCAISKDSVSKIRRHIRNSHRERTKLYKCPFCPFTSKHGVSKHMISKHKGDNEIEYSVCHTCGKRFKFKHHLVTHVKSHRTVEELMQTNEIYKCEHCPKMFRRKLSRTNHTKYYHKNNDSRPRSKLECDNCAFTCTNKKNLMYHIQKKHTPVAQLETLNCPECGFTTKFLVDLDKHKYKCHRESYQCPNQTHTHATLKDHKTLQEEDKKFKCSKCDYRTHKMSNLKDHSINHLKPEEIQYFYCFHCDFKTKRMSNLKVHLKRHLEQEVEFKCHICDFKTKTSRIYLRHIGEHKKELKSL